MASFLLLRYYIFLIMLSFLLMISRSRSGTVLPSSAAGKEKGKRLERMRDDERESDRVTNLPGQPPNVGFEHYAGYIKVGQNDHKALFYWFFQSQHRLVSSTPLLLWLNGGPGCSSVAYGAAQELGPFLIRNNSQILLNKFSWNKAANIIFLEAPVGVGFSYTNRSEDLEKLGDEITAFDSYHFLVGWFKRFPHFKSHDFYIAGESYAGHYVPQLANFIYDQNKRGKKGRFINLKGFMIGNAVINDETDEVGLIEYAWSHAIISDKLYTNIKNNCNFKSNNNKNNNNNSNSTIICSQHIRGFMEAYNDIDIYNIYAPLCLSSINTTTTTTTTRRPKLNVAPHLFSLHELWHKLRSGYDPCTEDYVETYFNRKDVQKALHANLTNLSYHYTPCSNVIRKWNDSPDTILPILHKLLNAGLRIWIFSGDTDGRVPVTSTRYSIKEMGLKIKEEWKPWFHNHQVAGWFETYEKNLTFITVRGAGHQVPMFAPSQSLSLFSHFLSGTTLPSSRY